MGDIVVYTDGDETFNGLLLPLIKGAMNKGLLNDIHPAIVNVAYLEEEAQGAESVSESGGIDNTALIIAVSVGATAFLVGVVVLAVVASKFWRKKKLQSVVAAPFAGTSPGSPTTERHANKGPDYPDAELGVAAPNGGTSPNNSPTTERHANKGPDYPASESGVAAPYAGTSSDTLMTERRANKGPAYPDAVNKWADRTSLQSVLAQAPTTDDDVDSQPKLPARKQVEFDV